MGGDPADHRARLKVRSPPRCDVHTANSQCRLDVVQLSGDSAIDHGWRHRSLFKGRHGRMDCVIESDVAVIQPRAGSARMRSTKS